MVLLTKGLTIYHDLTGEWLTYGLLVAENGIVPKQNRNWVAWPNINRSQLFWLLPGKSGFLP